MQTEAIKRISTLLKIFNETFELDKQLLQQTGKIDAEVELKISKLKNDGSQFIGAIHDTFNDIVTATSDEHEVIYHPEKGLVVAKKIVTTDYIPIE